MLAQATWIRGDMGWRGQAGCGHSPGPAPWKPCTSLGTLSVKNRWRNMMRTSAWQPLCSTSGDSAMSRKKPSAVALPSSASPSRPSSCEGESPEIGCLAAGGGPAGQGGSGQARLTSPTPLLLTLSVKRELRGW